MTMINSVAAAGGGSSVADQGGPPPRPRVREVSSRFMSPAPNPSSSAGDLHTLTMKSPISRPKPSPAPDRSSKPSPSQRRLLLHRSQEHETLSFSYSSQENIPNTIRSMDYTKPESNFNPTQRKQQRAAKLFKENEQNQISKSSSSTSLRTAKSSRLDTPTVATSDRIVPSRFRLPQRQTVTDAAKLLHQSTGLSFSSSILPNDTLAIESQPENSNESERIQGGSCPNSPISSQHTRTWPISDTRSSMTSTDEDALSTRLLIRSSSCNSSPIGGGNCPKFSSTPSLCSRSLNFPMISGGQNSFKSKPPTTNSLTSENRTLPPQPVSTKIGVGIDLRKGKKFNSSQEDVHSLKLLHNHYILWRYANAKARTSMQAQTTEIEKQFFSVGADISNLRNSVKKKQSELAVLRQIKALSTILDSQMPYLDEWSNLEDDYTCSLSEVTNALTNSLLRLPVSGNVHVNIKEAGEALNLAVKTADMILNHMQSFLPKAKEMDSLMSELASVNDIEKALVEECGNLLLKTHNLQVEDCSLRGHLMQLQCSKNNKNVAFVVQESRC